MLSKESSRFVDLYQYSHGMVNTVWVTGLVRHINSQRTAGMVQQTNNVNLMLPFKATKGDFIPSWVHEGEPFTIVGRIMGQVDPETGERGVVLTVLKFEHPDCLALPPTDVWEMSLPPGVARDDTRLPFGKGGLKLSKTSNIVHLAGYIGAMKLKKPGVVPDTTPGAEPGSMRRDNGGLVLLLQQVEDANRGIPVRVYSNKIESIAKNLRRGDPIYIADGEYRVNVKPTGSPADENGIIPVHKSTYVHVSKFGGATKKQILSEPEWVAKLREPVSMPATPARRIVERDASHEMAEEMGISAEAMAALS